MVRNLLPVILMSCSFSLGAQYPVQFNSNTGNDIFSELEKNHIRSLYELYTSEIDQSYELINGREYFPYYFLSKFKPILFGEKMHSSSITLNGRKFKNISLDYDTFTDEVIHIDSTRSLIYFPLRVALNKDNIDCFEFYSGRDTMSFRYFGKDSDPAFNLEDGFYEVVLNGKIKYLIKHNSILQDKPGIDEYMYSPIRYVNIGKGFSKIPNKKEFVKLFDDNQGKVLTFIKESGIKIRKADKNQILSVLRYYESLNAIGNK